VSEPFPLCLDGCTRLALTNFNVFSFGIIFTGNRHSEKTLLRAAYAFEQLTNVRNTPVPYNPPEADLFSS